nr:MAG TPA: hypothetical protein [Caudoviricetes sp.]DAM59330.1 MAG TPA: hypothetical protein [Caudoviricetes sp.]DAQ31809.1 MAG TPA: hypothetical protein [Caudoviricetes sp.]DAY46286.1 MAG TPA: hypothetical protein [Caudoviricetes sp.]
MSSRRKYRSPDCQSDHSKAHLRVGLIMKP